MTQYQTLHEWLQQYKDDEIKSIGETAAIKAIETLLEGFYHEKFGRADLKDGAVAEIRAAQSEIRTMLDILQAFQGRFTICTEHGI